MRNGHFKRMLWLLLAAAVPAAVMAWLHPRAPAWTRERAGGVEVGATWVAARGSMVLWVDARNELAFRRDAIPGAVNLNEERWDDLFPEFLARWAPGRLVVVYCDDRCVASQEVARRLRGDFQIENVFVLRGGRKSWSAKPSP